MCRETHHFFLIRCLFIPELNSIITSQYSIRKGKNWWWKDSAAEWWWSDHRSPAVMVLISCLKTGGDGIMIFADK